MIFIKDGHPVALEDILGWIREEVVAKQLLMVNPF
jgi:hypothetical protein